MKRLLYKNVRAYDCEVPSPSGGGINLYTGFGVEGNYFTSLCDLGILKQVSETELMPDKIIKVHYTEEYLKSQKQEPVSTPVEVPAKPEVTLSKSEVSEKPEIETP